MERTQDIQFLEEFRDMIDRYLFLGLAPSRLGSDYDAMMEALKEPDFQKLRQQIKQLKPRLLTLFAEFNIEGTINLQLPLVAGGETISFPVIDVVTDNPFPLSVDKHLLIGIIDEAIGVLKMNSLVQKEVSYKLNGELSLVTKGLVFIAMPMSPDDPALEDVHETIKETASSIGLYAQRTDDIPTNERITDRVLELIRSAEYVIADLTNSRPNVYWEAGYAHALGKTPVYIAREGTTIEFDLKDYPVIFFKSNKQLRQKLAERLTGLKNKYS